MAERIISPGVFTSERDLSFLIPGIAGIGGAFIGPTAKGPAFIPTVVTSGNDYVVKFGEADSNSYMGYTVKNYLQEAAQAVVVRILGLQGYDAAVHQSVKLYISQSGSQRLFAVLHPSISGSSITTASVGGTTSSLNISLTGNTGIDSASGLSLDPTSANYLVHYFGTDPGNSKQAYTYAFWPAALAAVSGSTGLIATVSNNAVNFSGSAFSEAITPWIQSQTVGSRKYNLFRLHTLSDGNHANTEVKVSFIGMKLDVTDPLNNYGTFSMVIRTFGDTDTSTDVVEQWDNVSMDPTSPNYIARMLGSSAPVLDTDTDETFYKGEFRNNSKYVYVEIGDIAPAAALPYGFGQLAAPVVLGDYTELITPTYINSRFLSGSTPGYALGAIDYRYYYGYDCSATNFGNLSYLNPTPASGSAPHLVGASFNLESVIDVPSGSSLQFSASVSLTDTTTISYRRFTVPFQGGFDGFNPATFKAMGQDIVTSNTQGFDLTNYGTPGSQAYLRGLDAVRNPESIDINMLVLPGVMYDLHSYVARTALTLCEDRQDTFYLMDLTEYSATIDTAINKAAEIDSNYTAAYYPWVQIIDTNTNQFIWAPPSVVLPEVYAYSDNVSAEWFAVAGLNRGGIPGAVGVSKRLNLGNRDDLYDGKVNPIAQFPGQGIVVWGQKTLQRRASALDRINVRRLLITVKKFIASSTRYLVFEQNVEATRNRFLNIVNPYLASIQERSGLYAFRVIMDSTNNTPDIIDRNILVGQIYLQPTKTAEFIQLEFNILPTGAIFPGA